MRYPSGTELPRDQDDALRQAIRLEWLSLGYWITAIIAIYFTLGQSQAMKAAWVEDILGLLPPIAFLIAVKIRHRDPTARFPWGYHRSITIAYLVATVGLFGLGAFMIYDSTLKLIEGVHPTIGLVEIFEGQIWLGFLMIAALVYSGIPPVLFGMRKRKLAKALHDKVLFADAKMNQADWMTAGAAIVGIIGIGFGLWWADSVAAILIAADIAHDGVRFTRGAISDLMDESPTTYDESGEHPVIGRVREKVEETAWVERGVVRLREHGHVLTGDVIVVPKRSTMKAATLIERVESLMDEIRDLDWRIENVTVTPVAEIQNAPPDLIVGED